MCPRENFIGRKNRSRKKHHGAQPTHPHARETLDAMTTAPPTREIARNATRDTTPHTHSRGIDANKTDSHIRTRNTIDDTTGSPHARQSTTPCTRGVSLLDALYYRTYCILSDTARTEYVIGHEAMIVRQLGVANTTIRAFGFPACLLLFSMV